MSAEAVIKPLPEDVIARIRSSIAINNLTDVVLGLVKNSLDANARTLGITVDFPKGACTVEDCGSGIPVQEFSEHGGLALRYHTSKYSSKEHQLYGSKGQFLASLAALALVVISSRHHAGDHCNALILRHAKPISRFMPAPPQYELEGTKHGTKVTVSDLFGNMPVRVKQRALSLERPEKLDREWDNLRYKLTALLISCDRPVKVTVTDASKSRRLSLRGHSKPLRRSPASRHIEGHPVNKNHILAVLAQAGYISPLSSESWVTLSVRTSKMSAQAMVSLEPSPTKQIQFISFGIRPLFQQSENNALYSEVNALFKHSSFGTIEDPTHEAGRSPGAKGRKIATKGVDRWPMFYCRICTSKEDELLDDSEDGSLSDQSLQAIINVIRAMFVQFLEQYHFLTGSRKRGYSRQDAPHPEGQAGNVIARPRSGSLAPRSISAESHAQKSSNHSGVPDIPNITIPSLHAITPQARSFSTWSRVKASRHPSLDDLTACLPREKGQTDVSNSAEVSRSVERPSTSLERSKPSSIDPEADSGKETPDFFGADRRKAGGSDGGLQGELIHYFDPNTKEKILINARTGQSMQRKVSSDDARPSVKKKRRTIEEGSKDTRWIDGLLGRWENPVFNRPETPLPSISMVEDYHNGEQSSYFHKREKKFSMPEHMHSSALPSLTSCDKKLTKKYLSCAKFLAQVDDKFLLVQMNAPGSAASHGMRSILVLIDQHAADERCRVENLFEGICRIRSKQCHDDAASADVTELPKPVVFTVSANEAQLFKRYAGYFRSWGCHYAITAGQKPTSTSSTITVLKVPTLIAERCRLEPKIVIDMLRREIWSQADQNAGYNVRQSLGRDVKTQTRPGQASQSLSSSSEPEAENASLSWTDHISNCPRGIVELLNSRACRSAIMFNDKLSRDECIDLIARLSKCAFPFRCAHGRPSMVPIVEMGLTSSYFADVQEYDGSINGRGSLARVGPSFQDTHGEHDAGGPDFVQAFQSWRRRP